MLKRALLFASLTTASGSYVWNGQVALWFGRFDEASWLANAKAPAQAVAEPGGPHTLELLETRRIVPSSGLSADLKLQQSNNNLHAVRHSDGRVYLAWRTAPTHFPDAETQIHVVSSDDEQHWRSEASFGVGSDLREPQLLSLGDELYLYVSRLGKLPFDFDPKGVERTTRGKDGKWSALSPVGLRGHIAWSVRAQGNGVVMATYSDGGNLYSPLAGPMQVRLLKSADGANWQPLSPAWGTYYRGGGSETDFAFLPSGAFLTVTRNEGGDSLGFGSVVCQSPRVGGSRDCRSDARKFDSPRLFQHEGSQYLVARRHLADDGRYDRSESSLWPIRLLDNQLSYITERKRCSIFRYVESERRFGFVMDLPSRGDTCFAAIVPSLKGDEVAIYDYSSDLEGPDVPWTVAQRRPTFVYRHLVRLRPRG